MRDRVFQIGFVGWRHEAPVVVRSPLFVSLVEVGWHLGSSDCGWGHRGVKSRYGGDVTASLVLGHGLVSYWVTVIV